MSIANSWFRGSIQNPSSLEPLVKSSSFSFYEASSSDSDEKAPLGMSGAGSFIRPYSEDDVSELAWQASGDAKRKTRRNFRRTRWLTDQLASLSQRARGLVWRKKRPQPVMPTQAAQASGPKTSVVQEVKPAPLGKNGFVPLLYLSEPLGDTTYGDEITRMTGPAYAGLRFRTNNQDRRKLKIFSCDAEEIAAHYARRITKSPSPTGNKLVEASAPVERPPAENPNRPKPVVVTSPGGAVSTAVTVVEALEVPVQGPKAVCRGSETGFVIDAFDNRKFTVTLSEYKIPVLDFAGVWNSTPLGAGSLPFARHFGCHVRDEAFIKVNLPTSLVHELMSHWVGVSRDNTAAHYMLTVIRARYLLRFVKNMTSEQLVNAVRYGPALAYMLSWRKEQNINRVVRRAFWTRNQVRALAAITAAVSVPVLALSATWLTAVLLPVGVLGLCTAGLLAFMKGRSAIRPSYVEQIQAHGLEYEERPVPETLTSKLQRVCERFDKPRERQKPAIYLLGIACDSHIPSAFANTSGNEQESIEKRIFVKDIEPENSVCRDFLTFLRNRDNMELLCGPQTAVSPKEASLWLKECGAAPALKQRYRSALARLQLEGITARSYLSKYQLKKYSKRGLFVKQELMNSEGHLGEAGKAPRAIQTGTDEHVVLTGPYIAALQGLIKKRWGIRDGAYSIWTAGLEAGSCAKFMFPQPNEVGYKKDFGKFDARQKETCYLAEVEFLKWFRAPQAVRQLHAASVDTVGFSALGWKYEIKWMRKSGDPWTSLFNTFLNKVMSLFAWSKAARLPPRDVVGRYRELVNGDDGAGAFPSDWDFKYYEYVHKSLGMDLEMSVSAHPYDVEYCSTRLVPSSTGPTFCPIPGKLLVKLPWTLKKTDQPKQVFKGTLLSIKNAVQVLPPLRAYTEILLERLGSEKAIDQTPESHKMRGDPRDANEETWHELERIYGWTRDQQARWETYLRTAPLPSIGSNVEFDLLCDHDCMAGSMYTPYVPNDYTLVTLGDQTAVRASEQAAANALQHAKNGNTTRVPLTQSVQPAQARPLVSSTVDPGFACNIMGTVAILDTIVGVRFQVDGGETFGLQPSNTAPCELSYDIATSCFVVGIDDVEYEVSPYSLHVTEPGPYWVNMATYISHLSGSAEALARMHNRAMHALKGNINDATGDWDAEQQLIVDLWFPSHLEELALALDVRPSWVARVWNRLMHALNGNSEDNGQQVDEGQLRKGRLADARNKLDRLAQAAGLSESDVNWIIQSIDPFHDEKINLAGMPDGAANDIVIQTINQQFTVSTPSGLSGGNWDCSVVMFPMLGPLSSSYPKSTVYTQNTVTGNGGDGSLTVQGAGAGLFGCIANTAATGNAISWVSPGGAVTTGPGVTIPAGYVNSPMRVIAAGYEIHNSTAMLSLQGNITNWRVPSPSLSGAAPVLVTGAGGTLHGFLGTVMAPAPPSSAAAANQLATARTWLAKDGVYMPCVLIDVNAVPNTSNCKSSYCYYDVSPKDTFVAATAVQTYGSTLFYPYNNNWSAMNLCGSYLTGLSSTTNILVNVRWIVETTPSPGDALITTARTSYKYNPTALAIYSSIMCHMPAGVPVWENSLGELCRCCVMAL